MEYHIDHLNEKELEFFKKIPDGGSLARTCVALGEYNDTEKNFDRAKIWFEKAVELNDPEGMVGLATLYIYERGVKEDRALAKNLLLRAADMGSAEAIQAIQYLAENKWEF